jgi:hypothetical protein
VVIGAAEREVRKNCIQFGAACTADIAGQVAKVLIFILFPRFPERSRLMVNLVS